MKVNPVAIPGTKFGNYIEQHHDIVFVPMAFESMGATGRTFTTFLRLVSEQVYMIQTGTSGIQSEMAT